MSNQGYNFKPAAGSIKKRTRKGRGNSAGQGGECGRGHKGQKSRSGYSQRFGFEGGQNPLYLRLPKNRGFNNIFKTEFSIVNLDQIEDRFKDGDVVDPESLVQKGLADKGLPVKVLARGKLSKKVTLKVHKISAQAAEKLKDSGSVVEQING